MSAMNERRTALDLRAKPEPCLLDELGDDGGDEGTGRVAHRRAGGVSRRTQRLPHTEREPPHRQMDVSETRRACTATQAHDHGDWEVPVSR